MESIVAHVNFQVKLFTDIAYQRMILALLAFRWVYGSIHKKDALYFFRADETGGSLAHLKTTVVKAVPGGSIETTWMNLTSKLRGIDETTPCHRDLVAIVKSQVA